MDGSRLIWHGIDRTAARFGNDGHVASMQRWSPRAFQQGVWWAPWAGKVGLYERFSLYERFKSPLGVGSTSQTHACTAFELVTVGDA